MKIIITEGNLSLTENDTLSWYFIADSALANAGKPFFIPEFADEFEAFLAPVVRINRIGKSVASRFANRYYAEMAPAIHFRASSLRQQLLAKGCAPDEAQSFDRSLIAGDFIPAETFCSVPVSLFRDGARVATWDSDCMNSSLGQVLEKVSASNTIKMGDFLIPAIAGPVDISIGNHLEVKLGEDTILSVAIK